MLHRRKPTLSRAQGRLVAETLPQWATLNDTERRRLAGVAAELLSRPNWEASKDFELDEAMRCTIAGHAALLAIGIPDPVYRGVRTIVVHPTTITLRDRRPGPSPWTVQEGPVRVGGHTGHNRPVFIAWDLARRQARHPERGHNVIFHEFAHKLDVEDGVVDGTPRMAEFGQRQRWIEVCQAEFDALRAGRGSWLLRGYAATNPGEFFAVATEAFFNRPTELAADRPELYEVLRAFYRQDPASR